MAQPLAEQLYQSIFADSSGGSFVRGSANARAAFQEAQAKAPRALDFEKYASARWWFQELAYELASAIVSADLLGGYNITRVGMLNPPPWRAAYRGEEHQVNQLFEAIKQRIYQTKDTNKNNKINMASALEGLATFGQPKIGYNQLILASPNYWYGSNANDSTPRQQLQPATPDLPETQQTYTPADLYGLAYDANLTKAIGSNSLTDFFGSVRDKVVGNTWGRGVGSSAGEQAAGQANASNAGTKAGAETAPPKKGALNAIKDAVKGWGWGSWGSGESEDKPKENKPEDKPKENKPKDKPATNNDIAALNTPQLGWGAGDVPPEEKEEPWWMNPWWWLAFGMFGAGVFLIIKWMGIASDVAIPALRDVNLKAIEVGGEVGKKFLSSGGE